MHHPNEPAIKKFIIPDQEHDPDSISAPGFVYTQNPQPLFLKLHPPQYIQTPLT